MMPYARLSGLELKHELNEGVRIFSDLGNIDLMLRGVCLNHGRQYAVMNVKYDNRDSLIMVTQTEPLDLGNVVKSCDLRMLVSEKSAYTNHNVSMKYNASPRFKIKRAKFSPEGECTWYLGMPTGKEPRSLETVLGELTETLPEKYVIPVLAQMRHQGSE